MQPTTHLYTPKGWKAESAWLAGLQRTVYPHKWSPVSCRSSAGQGKFAGQRLTFYHLPCNPETWRFIVTPKMVKIANIQLHSPFTCTLKILHPGCPALSISGALGQLPPPFGSLRHWLYPGTAGTVIFTTSQVGLFCGPNISKYYLRFILYFNRHRVNLCVKNCFY